MGCGSSDLNTVKLNKKRETVFGVLEVKVIEALIEHETTSVFSMDPYVVIKFSNQKRSGTVVKKGGKNPKFNDIFRFIVNSNYKYYGRCLEVELMDSNTAASDSPIGYGIIDLDPYLNALHVKSPESVPGQSIQKQPESISLRCFLNYDRRQAGFIMLSASFREEKVDILNLRFETAEFKRSTRTFGEMNCSVRVSIGEEILSTKQVLDTKTLKPVWKDEFLTFSCPASVQNVLIEVMDEQEVIGVCSVPKLDFLVQKITEQDFAKQFLHKSEPAGKLWFNSLLSHNPVFKDLDGDYKKKTTEELRAEEEKKKGEPGKETDNKEEKKQQKKEEKKQQKKQQKKTDQVKIEEKKPEQASPVPT